VKCAYCGKEETLPYQCRYCASYFCPDHRLPENHECFGLPKPEWGVKTGTTILRITKVRTRSGKVVDFDKGRITETISRRVKDRKTAETLTEDVVRILEQKHAGKVPTLKDIHNVVESVLIRHRKQPIPIEPQRPESKTRLILRNFTRALKKKNVAVLLVVLVMISIWAGILLLSRSTQLQAYKQFLNWALLIFGVAFVIGFMLTMPPKKKSSVRIRGEIEVEEGAEITIRAPPPPPRWRVSRRIAKWGLIIGGISTLLGLAYGIVSYEFGYLSVGLGGSFLGFGAGLYIYRRTYPR